MPTSRPNDAARILQAVLPEREDGQRLKGRRQIAATREHAADRTGSRMNRQGLASEGQHH